VAALATDAALQGEKRRAAHIATAVLHPVLGIGLSRIEAHLAEGSLVVVHFGCCYLISLLLVWLCSLIKWFGSNSIFLVFHKLFTFLLQKK